jgi:hypothetical protein
MLPTARYEGRQGVWPGGSHEQRDLLGCLSHPLGAFLPSRNTGGMFGGALLDFPRVIQAKLRQYVNPLGGSRARRVYCSG